MHYMPLYKLALAAGRCIFPGQGHESISIELAQTWSRPNSERKGRP